MTDEILASSNRPDPGGRRRAVAAAVGIHVGWFAVIVGSLQLAGLLGVTGWWLGFVANVFCCVYAAVLMTWLRLWRSAGALTPWRSWGALVALLPLVAEAVVRMLPAGLVERSPGLGWWALTLLLVGIYEEFICRGAVLGLLRRQFSAVPAVAITGALFGLQHLSLFVTTGRGAADILTNVLASAAYGFVLAAFQWRYAWLWPLVIVHAVADLTTLLSRHGETTALDVVTSVAFVVYAVVLLRAPRVDGR